MSKESYTILSDQPVEIFSTGRNTKLEKLIQQNESAIESAWRKTLTEKPELFNGRLPVFDSMDKQTSPGRVNVSFTDFRILLAKKSVPELSKFVSPVGVSGIVRSGTKYLIAKRASNLHSYPGFWEFVPSGHIEEKQVRPDGTIDFKSQLLDEFTEETSVNKNVIEKIQTLGLIHDCGSDVYDVVCQIDAEFEVSDCQSKEYSDFLLIDQGNLATHLAENRSNTVPTSLAIFALLFG